MKVIHGTYTEYLQLVDIQIEVVHAQGSDTATFQIGIVDCNYQAEEDRSGFEDVYFRTPYSFLFDLSQS